MRENIRIRALLPGGTCEYIALAGVPRAGDLVRVGQTTYKVWAVFWDANTPDQPTIRLLECADV